MNTQKLMDALRAPVTEKETKQLARICEENEYKATTAGAIVMLEQVKDYIGYEAYAYWTMVAMRLPD